MCSSAVRIGPGSSPGVRIDRISSTPLLAVFTSTCAATRGRPHDDARF